ncbi:C4-dicarboxylate TRAP transporter substrate-binding protein [Cellulosilyticum sp. I15G10I2]|uniref:C4-dicarboxylate TRAP transporter substrate-binding protein n=1 Tax=Cellulosilyticum sp. I15G10I2 TaxID=1892843 RepID=UPI00085CDA6B|nr:C4-dicarboxylate TRAP transporter substrate-binding protein [Cellulosilyticum sp. I15G10I2]
MKKKKLAAVVAVVMATVMGMGLAGCSPSGNAGTSASEGAGKTEAVKASGETYELKVSTTQPDTSMIYQGLKAAADKIAEDTNGIVKVTIYPSGQLGAEEDMIDQALSGVGVAVLTDAGRMSSYVKDIGIFNMAYFVDNYDDGLKVINTDTFKGWSEELKDQGIRVLCFNYYDGARSFMTQKEAMKPEDLKGLVIRTPGADPYNASITAMGATPYNVGWSEVYNSIQTKAIDGCEVQNTSAVSSHIYEVCKYVNKTEHINLFNCLIAGEKWFQGIPEEYKQVVLDGFYECAYDNAQDIVAAQEDLEKTLVDNGMTIVEVDKEAFKEAAESAYDKMGWKELRGEIYKEAGLN